MLYDLVSADNAIQAKPELLKRMSTEAPNLRQRKMVPYTSQTPKDPEKSAPLKETAGLINEGYEPMGSLNRSDDPEALPMVMGAYEDSAGVQGNTPRKKRHEQNGELHMMEDDEDAIPMDSYGGSSRYGEDETSMTAPLLSDDERIVRNNNNSSDIDDSTTAKIITPTEASWQIGLQVFFPYIIAGFGMVAAGMVLDLVQVRKFNTLIAHLGTGAACSFSVCLN